MKIDYKKCSEKSGIYKITNLINGKYYIGSTGRTFKKRASEHQQKSVNKHLKYAMKKYGKENFLFEVVQVFEGTQEELFKLEEEYL